MREIERSQDILLIVAYAPNSGQIMMIFIPEFGPIMMIFIPCSFLLFVFIFLLKEHWILAQTVYWILR